MAYTITCDGNTIYDLKKEIVLISPILTMEDSTAGSLEFTFPPDHAEYDSIQKLLSKVTVYRDGVEIWSGRPVEETVDFWKQKRVYCEGELAELNDTIQPQAEYHDMSERSFLQKLLDNHNEQVAASKRFTLGSVVSDENLYRFTNYETTLGAINEKVLSRIGGHIRIRKTNGVRYLDYLKDYPRNSSQIIRFGTNLLDYAKNFNMNDFCTAVLPLGAMQETSDIEALTKYLTVESVNGGSPYVKNNAAISTYGWIVRVVEWPDVTEPANLLRKARDYLNGVQYENMVLEVKAVDLNLVDGNEDTIQLLDQVRVVSAPHNLDRWFPVTMMQIPLADPAQTVLTLGTSYQRTLTSTAISANQDVKDSIERIPSKYSILEQAKENATQLITSGALGSHVVVLPDELYVMDTDDTATARKVWRFNVNGLGYSSTGINGPYGLAMTMDGSIVADRMVTGTLDASKATIINLNASNIKTGTLDASIVRIINLQAQNVNLTGKFESTYQNNYSLLMDGARLKLFWNGMLRSAIKVGAVNTSTNIASGEISTFDGASDANGASAGTSFRRSYMQGAALVVGNNGGNVTDGVVSAGTFQAGHASGAHSQLKNTSMYLGKSANNALSGTILTNSVYAEASTASGNRSYMTPTQLIVGQTGHSSSDDITGTIYTGNAVIKDKLFANGSGYYLDWRQVKDVNNNTVMALCGFSTEQ